MICEIWILPAGVSFRWVSFREKEAYATCTGILEQYCRANNVGHHPSSSNAIVDSVDPDKGSKLRALDRIAVEATGPGEATTTWSIPWEYTVRNEIFSHDMPKTVQQVATYTSTGKVTVTKGGASVSSDYNDPTERDPQFP